MTHDTPPMFSFVVAVYNVEKYLPEFLASIHALDVAEDDLELIFVDDGSVDRSAAQIDEWLPSCPFEARLLRQQNGGPASARNAGLSRAHGMWVSFPDADDVLARNYLTVIAGYLNTGRAADAAMIAARPIRFIENASSSTTPHPLDFKFTDAERIVDLSQAPQFIQLHTNTGFYRGALIRARSLRFDEEVRPVFEDAVFNIHYLSHAERPTVALLRAASYFYRRRADNGSLTGAPWRDPAMFAQLPDKGYLALLERFSPNVPRWIQNTVYYDLQWYFKADVSVKSGMTGLSPALMDPFNEILDRIVAHLDESTLLEFHAIDIPIRIRLSLVARKTGTLPPQNAYVTKLDHAQRIMQISYFTAEVNPEEVIRLDGTPIRPTYAKTTTFPFFGRTSLYQRDLWLPSQRPVSLRVAGRMMPVVYGVPSGSLFETSPQQVWRRYARQAPPQSAGSAPRPRANRGRVKGAKRWWRQQRSRPSWRLVKRVAQAASWSIRLAVHDSVPLTSAGSPTASGFADALRRRAASPSVRRRYGRAWLLIDRDTSAQDNAEAMYRYLRRDHPDVNAWFALSPRSADWPRLKREGFRLIEFNSIEYALALRNAKYLISSQADDYLLAPRGGFFGPRTWKFVFLQHGVIHNDLSRWLNRKPIRLMVTTTEAEHQSIVADGSPYLLSEKEVERTGLPRHDRLLAKARALPDCSKRLLLVAPTWRDYLFGPQGAGNQRELAVDLTTSAFFEQWYALLNRPDLVRLLAHEELELALLPHPNLQQHFKADSLPAHVMVASSALFDVQDVISRARVLITDYSSIAFDAAYIGTPVIYFQFDADEFFSGQHTVRPGEFSYRRDGFGPVAADPDEVVDRLAELLGPESGPLDVYRRRMAHTFTLRDGRCCERVYEAIRRREHPASVTLCPPERDLTRSIQSEEPGGVQPQA